MSSRASSRLIFRIQLPWTASCDSVCSCIIICLKMTIKTYTAKKINWTKNWPLRYAKRKISDRVFDTHQSVCALSVLWTKFSSSNIGIKNKKSKMWYCTKNLNDFYMLSSGWEKQTQTEFHVWHTSVLSLLIS